MPMPPERCSEAPIIGVYCEACGTHTTTLVPTRVKEDYDWATGEYVFTDITACGACGNGLKVQRRMKVTE